jgi:DNA-binding MarR family transcriptional regulator
MKYDLLEEYLNLISKITLEDKEQIKILKISKLRDRITYILCKNKGIYRFKNITYFASYLGTSRENLSREITKMEQENIIVRSKNTLRLICNCCEN